MSFFSFNTHCSRTSLAGNENDCLKERMKFFLSVLLQHIKFETEMTRRIFYLNQTLKINYGVINYDIIDVQLTHHKRGHYQDRKICDVKAITRLINPKTRIAQKLNVIKK